MLRFLTSPVAILGDGKVEEVEVVRNMLVADERGNVRAVPTDERETIPATSSSAASATAASRFRACRSTTTAV